MKTFGIDGCRAGWLAVSMDGEQAAFRLIESSDALTAIFEQSERIFIDIPIGLSEEKPRTCDVLLRRVLGKGYSSSVFSPPVRATLMMTDYEAACNVNEAKSGKRLSKQSWNIIPKIKEVDSILQEHKALAQHVHESHPELLFKKLNRGGAPLAKKKTDEGFQQRYDLLRKADGRSEDVFLEMRNTLKKSEAQNDDLLDALVLGVMAEQSLYRPVRTLPLPPEYDATALPMAVHFV